MFVSSCTDTLKKICRKKFDSKYSLSLTFQNVQVVAQLVVPLLQVSQLCSELRQYFESNMHLYVRLGWVLLVESSVEIINFNEKLFFRIEEFDLETFLGLKDLVQTCQVKYIRMKKYSYKVKQIAGMHFSFLCHNHLTQRLSSILTLHKVYS